MIEQDPGQASPLRPAGAGIGTVDAVSHRVVEQRRTGVE